jgi:methyl-accepting chemotaxis protein
MQNTLSESAADVSDLEARLQIFGITAETLAMLEQTWPIIRPAMPGAIDTYLDRCRAMAWVSTKLLPRRDLVHAFYLSHFEVIFRGWFDERYVASFQKKRDFERKIGFHDSRPHMSFGHYALRAATNVISHKYRFSALAAARRIEALMQALAFDNATTLAVIIDTLTQVNERRRGALDKAIQSFDATIDDVLISVKEASASLTAASDNMKSVADSTAKCVNSVTRASLKTKEDVSGMTSAIDRIAASISQIRSQAMIGSQQADEATQDAEKANNSIQELAAAVEQIGSIAEMITGVASQSNLLALNATIEAARAGEAGKGFGVVAAEVKGLANKTSQATNQIARQIADIQKLTQGAVGDINSVVARICELSKISTEIASAVQEQDHSTSQMGHGMQLVADGAAGASQELVGAEQTVTEGAAVAGEVLRWSETLSERATTLGEEVKAFFAAVWAA